MLQIVSGKFFSLDDVHETIHRGVFYTNYAIPHINGIPTPLGTLYRTVHSSGPTAINYEITERIKKGSALVATTGSDLVNDFCAVLSFSLNIICTSDADLTRRLLYDDMPAMGTSQLPRQLIPGIFSKRIDYSSGDEDKISEFFTKLISLSRSDFEGVLRAIRQWTVAMHRLSDNPDLSYTLFVAALESLAQDFDANTSTWQEYDERKRAKIDAALAEVSNDVAARIKNALLEHEHLTLRKRFKDFSVAHVGSAFYRAEAVGIVSPISSTILPVVLDSAYRIRSQYIHNLRPIPRNVMMSGYESISDGEETYLTMAGISRLARHVILNFMYSREAKDDRDFDWHSSLPGIIRLPMSSEYWIGRVEGFSHQNSKRYLSAHWEQIGPYLLNRADRPVTDLRPLLKKIEVMLPGLAKPAQRLPLIALYISFSSRQPVEDRLPNAARFFEKYWPEIMTPSIESLLLHVSLALEAPWTFEECMRLHDEYFAQKNSKKGISVGSILEIILNLGCAEQYRLNGDEDNARKLIKFAVENVPSNQQLKSFEGGLGVGGLPRIDWFEIIGRLTDTQQEQLSVLNVSRGRIIQLLRTRTP